MYAFIISFLFLLFSFIQTDAISQTEVDFYNLLRLRNLEVCNNVRIHGNLFVDGITTSNGIIGGGSNSWYRIGRG